MISNFDGGHDCFEYVPLRLGPLYNVVLYFAVIV